MKEVQVINSKIKLKNDVLRVAAYCRVSTDSDDQMDSFIAQVKYYNDFIKTNKKMTLVDIYADEGITGTCVNKRDEFQRMISDAKKGKIDRVIVKSVSRFARNSLECIENIRLLKSCGTSVLFENDGIDTEKMNTEMILYIKSAFAQSEALAGSKRVSTAYRMRMQNGKFTTYIPAFGYEMVDGKLKVVEEHRKTVQFIFDSYLQGMGRGKIAEILNKENVSGQKWSSSSIGYILSNEKYIGDSLVQKYYTPNVLPLIKKPNKGEKDKFYIENTHEAIISKEIFEEVRKKLKENLDKKSKVQTKEKSVFNGKIFCGNCGWSYKKKKCLNDSYWICSHDGIAGVRCDAPNVKQSDLEQAFIRMYNKLRLYESDVLDRALNQLVSLKASITSQNDEISEIDKEISIISEQNSMYNELKVMNIIDDISYYEKTTQIKHRLKDLKDKRYKLICSDDNERTLDSLRRLKSYLKDLPKAIFLFDCQLFESIVEKVYVYSTKKIVFRFIAGIELGVYI